MPQFGAQIDTLRIPIKGLIPEQSATALGTPVEGLLWHDTANKLVKVYLNGAWVQLTTGAGVSDGDKGDITVSGGGTVWTIDPNTVTSAKIVDGTIVVGDTATSFDIGSLSAAHPPSVGINMAGFGIGNLPAPTAGTDAANKAYVDSAIQGLDAKASCVAATVGANITLAGGAPNVLDGVNIGSGYGVGARILVKDQTDQTQNGIYTIQTVGTGSNGTWVRATDMDVAAEFENAYTWVQSGTINADTGWVCTTTWGTWGVTPVTWVLFSSAGTMIAGAGLTKTGNTIDVGAGTGIIVNPDSIQLDQTVTDGLYANVTGDTFTGAVFINGGLTANNQACSFGGNVTCAIAPSGPSSLTRKDYVDNAVALLAPIASPTFTGDPKAPTPTAGDNDTSIATTAFVTSAIGTAAGNYVKKNGPDTMNGKYTVAGAPGQGFIIPDSALPQDTCMFSDRLGWTATDGATYIGGLAMDNSVNKKMTLSYPTGSLDVTVPVVTFTGDARAVTPTAGDNDTSIATTAFVTSAVATAVSTKASKVFITLPALSAGSEITVNHGLNTFAVIVGFQVMSTNAGLELTWRCIDANNLGVTADVAFGASAVRCTVVG